MHLGRLCTVVRTLVALGAVALAGVVLWFFSSPDRLQGMWRTFLLSYPDETTLDSRAMWLGGAVTLVPIALGFFALWQLWRLFGAYARGQVFSQSAQRHLRGLAIATLASGILSPVVDTLLILAITLGNAPGHRLIIIRVSWSDYTEVLLGAVLLAIAAVMAEAVRLAEDHAGFV